MELDELKTKWTTVNAQLDQTLVSQQAMEVALKEVMLKPSKSKLAFEPGYEIFISALCLVWSGGFIASNFTNIAAAPAGILPAIVIFGLSLLTTIVNIRQLILISEMSYSAPIVEAQTALAKVRALRMKSTQAVMLIGIPTWFLPPMFLLQSVAGYGVMSTFDLSWLLTNIGVGAIISTTLFLASRRYGKTSKFFSFVDQVFAGDAVIQAEANLQQIRNFERA